MINIDSVNTFLHAYARQLVESRGIPYGYIPGCIFFTGLKGSQDNAGYVGQWVDYRTPPRFFYINLPNMAGGEYAKGAMFEIGCERILDSVVNIPNMLVCGLDKLLELPR